MFLFAARVDTLHNVFDPSQYVIQHRPMGGVHACPTSINMAQLRIRWKRKRYLGYLVGRKKNLIGKCTEADESSRRKPKKKCSY